MDAKAFEQIYSEHAQQLVRFLLYRTGDVALAEDLAADTFERVLRARRPFDARKASQKTWLYSIALNVLRDHLRRRHAEERAVERAESPVRETASETDLLELRTEVSRALATLAPAEREAVALRYGADLTIAQIAWLSGERHATVEKRLYRALARLRETLPAAQSLL